MTPSFTYDPIQRAVFWNDVKLAPESCEALLDIFDREGAVREFNALYDCHMRAGGVPRVSSLRVGEAA